VCAHEHLEARCEAAPENDAAIMRALGEDPEQYQALKRELATAWTRDKSRLHSEEVRVRPNVESSPLALVIRQVGATQNQNTASLPPRK
jgi:hypothetical protein